MNTETLKRDHVFNQTPSGWNGQGIPAYMACSCGVRWYADKAKPKSTCKQRRVSP